MQKYDFEHFLKRLYDYYDKKDGKNIDRNRLHYQKVQWIPGGEVVNGLYEIITDEYEYFPKNLPKAIKKAWDLYKAENPEKIIKLTEKQHAGCENCDKGRIYFTVYEANGDGRPELAYRYSVPCGHCRQDFTKEPKLTTHDVRKRGGVII